MIIILLGASGVGKRAVKEELVRRYDFEEIIPYTTKICRDVRTRDKDCHSIQTNQFATLVNAGVLAEYDEYPQGYLSGTLRADYLGGNKVAVLTPAGLRQVKQNCPYGNIFTVLLTANLGTRIKRYIDACGVDRFDFRDKDAVVSRVERDFAMFSGVEKEVNFVIENHEGTRIEDVVREILRLGGFRYRILS